MKIIIERIAIDREPEAVSELLRLLGHPEAFVTDLSTFLDFLSPLEYKNLSEAQTHLDSILPVPVPVESTLVDAIRIIHATFPSWPK